MIGLMPIGLLAVWVLAACMIEAKRIERLEWDKPIESDRLSKAANENDHA